MTHILIPREPNPALLRPFTGCPQAELPLAYAAMVRVAEVQNTRTPSAWQTLRDYAEGRIEHRGSGSCPDSIEGHAARDSDCPVCKALDAMQGCLAQIEEPAALAEVSREQYARMFGAACEALGQVSDCLGINSDIDPGAEPIIAAIELLRAGKTHPVLDDRWKARLLDSRAPERDEMGLGDHPELPQLDEGMRPRSFFAALGLELTHTTAESQLDSDALDAMSEAVNWTDWQPTSPQGDGWKLVSIFDTEDGPAAWWLRELPEAEDGTTAIRNLQAEEPGERAMFDRNLGLLAGDMARLVRDLDVALHGEADAAPQASLCDIVCMVKKAARELGRPVLAASGAHAVDAISQAARDVLAERRRQVSAEGFSHARDDQYVGRQLAGAATSYLILAAGGREDEARAFWPWRQEWLKPGSQRRYLEKACALGLAEMERMDRAAAQNRGAA